MSEIKETIQDILAAETKAEQIVEDANRKSKDILLDAQTQVAEIKSRSEASIKSSVKDIITEGERLAKEAYDAIVKDGEDKADALLTSARGKEEQVSDYIVNKFIDGVKVNYGNS
jgi:vacuolar-type H+-ATPase subunit H